MIADKSVIAIIPARAGSKGLPGKQCLLAVRQAADRLVDRVSARLAMWTRCWLTDGDEIARIAAQSGATVPFAAQASCNGQRDHPVRRAACA